MSKSTARSERKRSREAFVEPFADLLNLVDSTREGGIYPLFPQVDRTVHAPVVFVANDYLALSQDERVRAAAREAIVRLGTSRCASPLAGGFTSLHAKLEQCLAEFLEQEEAALFASGYQANVGIISALMQRGDLVATDLLDHASIVDGVRLSGAQLRFFRHNDPDHLARVLDRRSGRRALVIVEGIYSADGDIVRLDEICRTAHERDALVMIDEAHSLGVLGSRGRGAAEQYDLLDQVDVIMGTLSKSLASVGGFVACDTRLIDVVRHRARALIFSAALPPAAVAAAQEALRLLEAEPKRRERLWHNADLMLRGLRERGFDTMESETPVIPIRVGDPARTLELTAHLRARGIFVCPAIPPMVRASSSRVRLHVTAGHDDTTLARALDVICEVGSDLGLRKRPRGHALAAAAGAADGLTLGEMTE